MSAPKTTFTSANMDFARGNNEAYVKKIAGWGSVMMLCEAKDFTLAKLLPGSWKSLQNTSSDAKAGSCIAFDTDVWRVEDSWLDFGCDEVQGSDGMLARWIQTAVLEHRNSGKQAFPMACHAPPKRFQDQRMGQFVSNLKKARHEVGKPCIGMDANIPIEDMAKKVGDVKAYGYGIVGNLTNMRVHKVTYRGWGEQHGATDHPAVSTQVELVKQG